MMNADIIASHDLELHSYNDFKRPEDPKTQPIFPSKMKRDMYQLVYDALENDEDGDLGLNEYDAHIGYLKKREDHQDSDSLDLSLTPSQRVAKLLGRSDHDTWSLDNDSTSCAINPDSRTNFGNNSSDFFVNDSLEDTFQNDLKQAKEFHDRLRSLSPILGSESQEHYGFEDDADFSKYQVQFLNSTPMRQQENVQISSELNNNHKNFNKILETDLSLNHIEKRKADEERRSINTEESDGLVRIVKRPSSDEQNKKLANDFKLISSVSPSSSKNQSQSLASKLRNTLTRSLPPTVKLSNGPQTDITVEYSGPPRYELDTADCFFEDEITYLYKEEDGPDPDDAKMFRGYLELHHESVAFDGNSDKARILSDQVQLNADDDYENALSQDPSRNVLEDWNKEEQDKNRYSFIPVIESPFPQRIKFSTFLRNWIKNRKCCVLMFSITFLALLIFCFIILGRALRSTPLVVRTNDTDTTIFSVADNFTTLPNILISLEST